MSDPLAGLDLARCEHLVARAGDGDAAAWNELVTMLWPCLLRLARSSRGPKSRSEDHVHDVATAVLDKLGGHDGRGLRQFGTWRQRHADKDFADWIRIVHRNVERETSRRELGPARNAGSNKDPSVKRLLNEFATSPALERLGIRPPMTAAQTARQLLEFARLHLPADQYGALTQWMQGASFEEIATEMGLGEAAGSKLVRAAVATIRRHFLVADKSA